MSSLSELVGKPKISIYFGIPCKFKTMAGLKSHQPALFLPRSGFRSITVSPKTILSINPLKPSVKITNESLLILPQTGDRQEWATGYRLRATGFYLRAAARSYFHKA
jgi:hypothetical protein